MTSAQDPSASKSLKKKKKGVSFETVISPIFWHIGAQNNFTGCLVQFEPSMPGLHKRNVEVIAFDTNLMNKYIPKKWTNNSSFPIVYMQHIWLLTSFYQIIHRSTGEVCESGRMEKRGWR